MASIEYVEGDFFEYQNIHWAHHIGDKIYAAVELEYGVKLVSVDVGAKALSYKEISPPDGCQFAYLADLSTRPNHDLYLRIITPDRKSALAVYRVQVLDAETSGSYIYVGNRREKIRLGGGDVIFRLDAVYFGPGYALADAYSTGGEKKTVLIPLDADGLLGERGFELDVPGSHNFRLSSVGFRNNMFFLRDADYLGTGSSQQVVHQFEVNKDNWDIKHIGIYPRPYAGPNTFGRDPIIIEGSLLLIIDRWSPDGSGRPILHVFDCDPTSAEFKKLIFSFPPQGGEDSVIISNLPMKIIGTDLYLVAGRGLGRPDIILIIDLDRNSGEFGVVKQVFDVHPIPAHHSLGVVSSFSLEEDSEKFVVLGQGWKTPLKKSRLCLNIVV